MLAAMSGHRVVVLLEGQSDVAAVRALLGVRPVTVQPDRLDLVDMGGVTNIRRHLADLVAQSAHANGDAPARLRVLGLCDVGEAGYFARALASIGHPVGSADDMAALGFHVCDQDLEDELIRALGVERVIEVLDRLRLLDRFVTFRRQPTWEGRPVTDQLRRFSGTTSGRKALVAQALAAATTAEQVPPPLAALVAHIAAAAADDEPGPAVRPFSTEP
ncbi:hypothetical protein ASC58_15400 [Phycicoccus sp. Root101]|nr:hypothetical protein ASC58_15400 [Phycicoccus sp. Root101]